MSDEWPHGQTRRIEKVEVNTPLLVPSFSSRGFPLVREIYPEMKDKLFGVCLVSALDLARSYVPASVTKDVNLVFMDSGLYEARDGDVGAEDSRGIRGIADWTRDKYLAIAKEIGEGDNVVLVNFDQDSGLRQQIDEAQSDFSVVPHAARDFLAKPESPARLLNVARMAKYAQELGAFDIVGITAREAGDSLVDRCRTLVMLRDGLGDASLSCPIHVFGAISPLEVLTYFFCGADVFDGLNWLRLGFREQASIPIEEAAFEDGKTTMNDIDLLVEEWTANLGHLYRLQASLQRYAGNRNLEELAEAFPVARRAARIAEMSGAVLWAQ